jgi:uncharacterized protein DUF3237
MRLEPLCELRLRYDPDATWLTPYEPYGGRQAIGFGEGSGEVLGERVRGTIQWANHPPRREDGVWCPNLTGAIATEDGARIIIRVRGISILEKALGQRRAIVATAWFHAEDARYRWLNYILGIGEGEIDEDTKQWWIRFSEARNEIATGPPAIT